MFNFFKKSNNNETRVRDVIWMSETAKWQGCVQEFQKEPSTLFITWFDDTMQQLESMLSKENVRAEIIPARQMSPHQAENRKCIFIEHYPLKRKETEMFEKLHLKEAVVFSSLDEPLFKHFGGEKVIQMMKQLGMKETESTEHKMISGAIVNAQEKLGKKITLEQTANSQAEWIRKNC
jgi:hypothetical protein